MSESAIQSAIRLAARDNGQLLWRNNSGAYFDKRGVLVRYGLGNTSKAINKVLKSSDLIGVTRVNIQPHHLGRTIAVFTALEIKQDVNKIKSPRELAQANYINLIGDCGGIAGFCDTIEDVEILIREFIQ